MVRRSSLVVCLAVVLAACAGGGDDAGTDAAPTAAEDGVVALTGTDGLRWSSEEVTADTGDLTFELTCEPAVNHNLVIDGEMVAECAPGETVTGTAQLEPGEHTFVCTIPGHERTMQGTITVS